MKQLFLFLTLISFSTTGTYGAEVMGNDADSQPQIIERGLHHRVWSKLVPEATPDGQTRLRASEVVELASGMHRFDQATGQFVDASADLTSVDGGCAANNSAHWLGLAANVNTANALQIVPPGGTPFAAHFAGVALWDTATGNSVFFPVRDSIGELHPPNNVLYRNVVDGLDIDLQIVNKLAGVSQSVIFRKQFTFSLADLQMNEATTRILCYTAIDDAPEPQKELASVAEGQNTIIDETLDFAGALHIGRGTAFSIDGTVPGEINVIKNSVHTDDQRRFLVESVAYSGVKPYLASLPAAQQAAVKPKAPLERATSIAKLASRFPRPAAKKSVSQRMQTAKLELPRKGLLVDFESYSTANSTNFTFEHSKTYYISGDFGLYGTNYLEPCVIKFAPTNSSRLKIAGTLICQTTPIDPAILTARDDRNYGENVGTNTTVSGYYADTGIYFTGNMSDLSNLRILYAKTGINYDDNAGKSSICQHVQIAHCETALAIKLSYTKFRNLLVYDVQTNLFNVSYPPTITFEHLTTDRANYFVGSPIYTPTVLLTNCLLVAVTNFGIGYTTNSSSNVEIVSDPSTVFQTVLGGAHYLRSDYTSTATSNINSSLLTDFAKFSAHAPLTLTNLIAINTTLSPIAERMASHLSCGYAYPALDYVSPGSTISNATLTLTSGTGIGLYPIASHVGLLPMQAASIECEGTPTTPVNIVRYDAIHENALTNWATDGRGYLLCPDWHNPSPPPTNHFRFTEFSAPGAAGYHLYGINGNASFFSFRDCGFHSSGIYSFTPTIAFTNCLFEGLWIYLDESAPFDLTFQNCLFYLGTNLFSHYDVGTWRYRDNLFYKSGITVSDDPIDGDYNAYLTNWTKLTTTGGSNDVVVNATSIEFQTASLGHYYLPTNSTLIDAGSVTNAALLGFYHYTTLTNQTKELTNHLDISLHYVATTNGVPIDTDGDGYPDYLEDANGNGSVDSGETDWQNGSDFGLRVRITYPRK